MYSVCTLYIPYACHYNPRFVYFLPTFWSSFMYCDLWPYVWLVFKSGFKSRAGYSGAYGNVSKSESLINPNNHFTKKREGNINVLCVNQWLVLNRKSDRNISDGLFYSKDFFLVSHIFVDDAHQVFFIWSRSSWNLIKKSMKYLRKKTKLDLMYLCQICGNISNWTLGPDSEI